MKKIFSLLLSVALASGFTNAQTITADELISKSNCKSFDCYNAFIIKKKFRYDKSSEFGSANMTYTFISEDFLATSNPEIKSRNVSSIIFKSDSSISVSMNMTDKDYYQRLLEAFKEKGFKPTDTYQVGNGVEVFYRSSSFPGLSLLVDVRKFGSDEQNWMSYGFMLIRR